MQNWQQTLNAQYQNSPVITALLQNWNDALDPSANIAAFVSDVMNVNTAVGYGLDVLGAIVGVSRFLTVAGYSGGSYPLSDSAYRLLIQAKAFANISDATIPNINSILMNIFPGLGDCYCVDNENMTMSLVFGFDPNPVQTAIIDLLFTFLRPAGVLLVGPSPTYGALAISIQSGTGYNTSGPEEAFTFPSNLATVTGGSGSFTFLWSYTNDAKGAWSDGGKLTASIVLAVAGVGPQVTSNASLSCTVTDTITGDTATSSAAAYSFQDTIIPAFTVSIQAGSTATAASGSHTFGTNTTTVVGGSGHLLFDWIIQTSSGGSWVTGNGATPTTTPSVSGVGSGINSTASIVCRVTDTITGLIVTSAPATYAFKNTTVVVVASGTLYASSTINPAYSFPPVSVAITGGSGSFSYAWSFVTLDTPPGTWVLAPNGASCQVACTHLAKGSTSQIEVTCTVTDTVTMQTYTSNAILFSYEYEDVGT